MASSTRTHTHTKVLQRQEGESMILLQSVATRITPMHWHCSASTCCARSSSYTHNSFSSIAFCPFNNTVWWLILWKDKTDKTHCPWPKKCLKVHVACSKLIQKEILVLSRDLRNLNQIFILVALTLSITSSQIIAISLFSFQLDTMRKCATRKCKNFHVGTLHTQSISTQLETQVNNSKYVPHVEFSLFKLDGTLFLLRTFLI